MDRTILIADDEPEHLLMLESLLKERGYTIIVASDGQEAVEKAQKVKPNLIILDIIMPNMDGTEAAMILKSDPRTRNIPIFFLTAVISPEDNEKVKGSSHMVFAKPVRFDELLGAIERVELLEESP